MKVSVLIPCRNEELFISQCLESILNNGYPADLLEIFVCDGMSTDRTRGIIEQFSEKYPFIRLIENPALYTPVALNLGIENSTGDIIIIFGAHAEMLPGFIENSVKVLQNHKETGCAGGKIISRPVNEKAEWIGKAMESSFGVGNARFRTGGREGYVDTVAFGAYSREVFEKAGRFDEKLIRNQDDEFNYRLQTFGYKIWYTEKIQSLYYVRGSFRHLFRQYFQYGYWKVFVNRKHRIVTTWRQTVPFFFVLWILAGFAASMIFHSLLLPWIGGIGLYFCSSLLFSIVAASKLKEVPFLIWVYLILHISYGTGYLEGIIRFLILRQDPVIQRSTLSR